MITEEILKDCDAKYSQGFLDGVENTPPEANDSLIDSYQMLDEIKFLKTKLAEKNREIDFLKQDLDRTLDVSFYIFFVSTLSVLIDVIFSKLSLEHAHP